MNKFLASAVCGLALLFSITEVGSQSNPGLTTGQVPTATQWNSYFASKQDTLGFSPVNRSGDAMQGLFITFPSSANTAGFNIPQGSIPSSPNNGDIWTTSTGVFARINGTTVGPLSGPGGTSFAATAPLGVTFPGSVVTYALNVDAQFATVGGNLAFAFGSAGCLIANATSGSAEPTCGSWSTFANQAIGSSNGMLPYRTGGVWSTILTGTSGAAIPLLNGANTWSGAQTINLNSASALAADTGTVLQELGADATVARHELTAFGAVATFTGRGSLGTNALPTTITSGTLVSTFNLLGYDGTSWFTAPAGALRFYAEGGNWSNTSHPTQACLSTTPLASTTIADQWCIHQDGGATLGSPTGGDKGAGTLNIAGSLFINGSAASGTGTVTSAQVAAGAGISVTGTCTITTTGVCTVAAAPTVPVVCDIILTSAATCNNGGSTANNGTYTTPASALYLEVRYCGGGAGGAGNGSGAGSGSNGVATTFGSALLTGNFGSATAGGTAGGLGGTSTGGDQNLTGGTGGYPGTATPSGGLGGGMGGLSAYYAGGGSGGVTTGANALANTGGGGQGASGNGTVSPQPGGGAGGCGYKIIASPSATYAYAVGTGGNGGAAGASGLAGGNGAAGRITVTARFQ